MDKVQFNNIPDELKHVARWIPWKFEKRGEGAKLAKLPKQLNGFNASVTNTQHWNDFLTAKTAVESGKFDGIGFVFDGSDYTGIDLDDCRNDDGTWKDHAKEVLDQVEGYAEISPSDKGLKIFTRAKIVRSFKNDEHGVEVYDNSRYFTVTGNKIQGSIPSATQDLGFLFDKYAPQASTTSTGVRKPDPAYKDLKKVNEELLQYLDADEGYELWLKVGMGLYHQFDGAIEALELWESWSADGSEGKHNSGECESKWRTFGGRDDNAVTIGTLKFYAKKEKLKEHERNGHLIFESDNDYDLFAKTVLDYKYDSEDGFTITYTNSEWYQYLDNRYVVVNEDLIEADIREVINNSIILTSKGEKVLHCNLSIVANILSALKSIVLDKTIEEVSVVKWLKDGDVRPKPTDLISLENGLLNIRTRKMMPNTRDLFSTVSLPFAYDAEAQCPEWIKFLDSVWGDDPESIDALQEIFGYLVSNDTTQQKFFTVTGPTRSGKGTINNVLDQLVGSRNVANPTLDDLKPGFSRASLIGKSIISITDAVLPDRNQKDIVGFFLNLAGGDPVSIERKYLPEWKGKLPGRIIIFSNEMLSFKTVNRAFYNRMISLVMTKSFEDNPDTELGDRLSEELAGILNWALQGNDRRLLRNKGRFKMTESGEEIIKQTQSNANPILEFKEDYLTLGNGRESVKLVYQLYLKFAQEQGIVGARAGTVNWFSKKLMDSFPTKIKTGSTVKNMFTDKIDKAYVGVTFTDKARSELKQMNSFEGI